MKNKVDDIIWKVPSFKTGWWCDLAFINNELRFKMFFRWSDRKCFVENVRTNELIEFNGAKAQGIRIIASILEKENKIETKICPHCGQEIK